MHLCTYSYLSASALSVSAETKKSSIVSTLLKTDFTIEYVSSYILESRYYLFCFSHCSYIYISSQGKKHQSNLGRRAAKEAKDAPQQPAPEKARVDIKQFVKIGRPGYRVTKQRCPESGQQSLMFEVDYPEIAEGIQPRHRFMSAYEQKMEPPDRKWQYLLFAAEPYETIAFKVLMDMDILSLLKIPNV